jgi:hypothetical protein
VQRSPSPFVLGVYRLVGSVPQKKLETRVLPARRGGDERGHLTVVEEVDGGTGFDEHRGCTRVPTRACEQEGRVAICVLRVQVLPRPERVLRVHGDEQLEDLQRALRCGEVQRGVLRPRSPRLLELVVVVYRSEDLLHRRRVTRLDRLKERRQVALRSPRAGGSGHGASG